MKEFILDFYPSSLRECASRSLFNRRAAEEYRKRLWYEYSIGDNVDDHPLNDGKNGASEFTTMCAKFKIPLIRLHEDDGIMNPLPKTVLDQKGDAFR